jgi:hypothetical protein
LRDFLDAILAFIGTTSLTDIEWGTITVSTQEYSVEVYAELLAVLDSREAVSDTRDRLRYYFLARGVSVSESSAGSSQIYVGSSLE